jgi:hypothetical protein
MKTIICKFDAILYVSHRIACLEDIIYENIDKLSSEDFEYVVDNIVKFRNTADYSYFYNAKLKLEELLGITILDVPKSEP